jgi:hypothetical protein
MKRYTQEDVDRWVEENGETDAYGLFREVLPGYDKKLDRLDKRIAKLLSEIRDVFPDAEYYTASGGFSLVLGCTHGGYDGEQAQQQRTAWGGSAEIGDGDW